GRGLLGGWARERSGCPGAARSVGARPIEMPAVTTWRGDMRQGMARGIRKGGGFTRPDARGLGDVGRRDLQAMLRASLARWTHERASGLGWSGPPAVVTGGPLEGLTSCGGEGGLGSLGLQACARDARPVEP